VEREREREGGIYPLRERTILHPCMRVPEWNSLCWLVERDRGKEEEENYPLRESESFPRSSRRPSYIKEVSVVGPSNMAHL
jgi:hypothetical protein